MTYIIHTTNGSELYHHGILGQKWGVRRYQNYDGSYTQAGMKRYNASKEKYDEKKAAYDEVRKSKDASAYAKDMARAKMKEAKKQMDKDYKHLRKDMSADKGKVMYKSGERIRYNNRKTRQISNALFTAGSMASFGVHRLAQMGLVNEGNKYVAGLEWAGIAAIGGSIAYSTVQTGVNYVRNQHIRDYYNHTSKY